MSGAKTCPICGSVDVRFDTHSGSVRCLGCGFDTYGLDVPEGAFIAGSAEREAFRKAIGEDPA